MELRKSVRPALAGVVWNFSLKASLVARANRVNELFSAAAAVDRFRLRFKTTVKKPMSL